MKVTSSGLRRRFEMVERYSKRELGLFRKLLRSLVRKLAKRNVSKHSKGQDRLCSPSSRLVFLL